VALLAGTKTTVTSPASSESADQAPARPPLGVLVKPACADCNLACAYCFYTPKSALYPDSKRHRMSPAVLERFISSFMPLAGDNPSFGWQGGEPTLMGLDFFRKVILLEKRYGRSGQAVGNGLQTNGTLIDDEWAAFLARWNFLVGISIDGPPEIHDHWRLTRSRRGSLAEVLKGLEALKRQRAEFNALVMVTSLSARRPDDVFDFLLEQGIRFFQFIPCVERDPVTGEPAEFTVDPVQYGEFMCRIFDRWADESGPQTYVRMFDDLLMAYVQGRQPTCIFQDRCGSYVVVEHNGDVYCCDFFVDPEWRLGNLMETPLAELAASPLLEQFAQRKSAYGDQCRECEWVHFCHGGCPKHRLAFGDKPSDPNYLCPGYKLIFAHADPTMQALKQRHASRSAPP